MIWLFGIGFLLMVIASVWVFFVRNDDRLWMPLATSLIGLFLVLLSVFLVFMSLNAIVAWGV